jgi:hypothetical protein
MRKTFASIFGIAVLSAFAAQGQREKSARADAPRHAGHFPVDRPPAKAT